MSFGDIRRWYTIEMATRDPNIIPRRIPKQKLLDTKERAKPG
jgi:hypothetical protein